jgi:hypothetical protein
LEFGKNVKITDLQRKNANLMIKIKRQITKEIQTKSDQNKGQF